MKEQADIGLNDVWFPNQNPCCVSNFGFVFQRRIKFQNHKSYQKFYKRYQIPETEKPGHQDYPLPALGAWGKQVPRSFSEVTGSWGPHLAIAAVDVARLQQISCIWGSG